MLNIVELQTILPYLLQNHHRLQHELLLLFLRQGGFDTHAIIANSVTIKILCSYFKFVVPHLFPRNRLRLSAFGLCIKLSIKIVAAY